MCEGIAFDSFSRLPRYLFNHHLLNNHLLDSIVLRSAFLYDFCALNYDAISNPKCDLKEVKMTFALGESRRELEMEPRWKHDKAQGGGSQGSTKELGEGQVDHARGGVDQNQSRNWRN